MVKIGIYSAIVALTLHCSALAPPQIPFEGIGDHDASIAWTLSTDARYSARVKTPHLCDGSGKSYSGYLTRDDGVANLFFWYFPSRKHSENAPLSLWLNGGPGSSSLFGLGYGVGPCHIEKEGSKLRMSPNEYPWTDFTNVLFIDQPIGTGFSYGASGGFDSSNGTAEDVYALIQMFGEKFGHHEVQINSLSYGGHYVPTLATVILDHNDQATQPHVNLTKVSIGNGWFAAPSQYRSFVELPCEGHYKHGKLMMKEECQYAYARAEECEDMLKRCQGWHVGNGTTRTANAECAAVGSFCWDALTIEYDLAKLNEYDVTRPSPDPLYDEEGELISRYYSQKEVQIALGALPLEPTPRDVFYGLRKDAYDPVEFQAHSEGVGRHYHVSGDKDVDTVPLLKTVLERGVQVLMYTGLNDWVCNYVGVRPIVIDIAAEKMWPLKTQDMHRCKEVSGSLFCYAEIEDAGHMAISDRPEYMQGLAKKWTFGKLRT